MEEKSMGSTVNENVGTKFRIGLDVGSTTIKSVVIDDNNNIVYSSYERHFSRIAEKVIEILKNVREVIPKAKDICIAISGSAGIGISEYSGVRFIQEVYATRVAANTFIPQTDVIIELGGEDAKILFLSGSSEVRMNGTCAGGTGAFIDQMATLLNIPVQEMDNTAMGCEKIYTIASRCGVFAKTDIQPLLNQGAKKSDIAASIFHAVVNQTLAGLAQGRKIDGKVVYLGGPLTFMPELRKSFDSELGVRGICPDNSLYYVALGAALCANTPVNFESLIEDVNKYRGTDDFAHLSPLFENEDEYEEFTERHQKSSIKHINTNAYTGRAYLGVDAGSTTVKAVLINEDGDIIYSEYLSNSGNPVPIVKGILEEIYMKNPELVISSGTVTGYGEDLVKSAFGFDFGIVETVAHFIAAKRFLPDVEFVIDIGGQDIKCFKVHNGSIDNIFLNEACSSGCGSFLQTFANALGYEIEDFAKLGLMAKNPVDLGSRCTVFMNSSVKQAQKEGASIEDISAGLSLSVVKNALYKVIRASGADDLGKNIVVQGGTFLNDAVLRAFEIEIGTNVIRPQISGLMGAFGAALYALNNAKLKSSIIDKEALKTFTHNIKATTCKGCSNHCKLTINTFNTGKRYIGGNRCETPITGSTSKNNHNLNMHEYKLQLLDKYSSKSGVRETIGIPMGLNMYELLPFWYTFFTCLGFGVKTSARSSRQLYQLGQQSIPSDTVCFPAKLIHGHVEDLLASDVDAVFYPCMTYNFDEHLGDNHYNCPVVAYYPEVIKSNMANIKKKIFINDYIGIHRQSDFPYKMVNILSKYFSGISKSDVRRAAQKAYMEQENYFKCIRCEGDRVIREARNNKKGIIVLAGRPYHLDPEINHGIDKLIEHFNVAIVSEDAVSNKVGRFRTQVLNQWTYHSRLYAAARYVSMQKDMNLVQLVSFGCGVDAITTDEVRAILEENDKIYTQIKIDEITNLGAVKIRLRSLFAAVEEGAGDGFYGGC